MNTLLSESFSDSISEELSEYAKLIYERGISSVQSTDSIKILNNGAGRVVIEHKSVSEQFSKDVIIKIALHNPDEPNLDGLRQNRIEKYIDENNTILSAFSLPIIESENKEKPHWIIYPKAELVTEETYHEIHQPMDELESKGIKYKEFYDYHNWGFWNYQSYLIDFGVLSPKSHCKSNKLLQKII